MYQNTRIKLPNRLEYQGPLDLESRGRGPAGVRKCDNFRRKVDFMMFMFPNPRTFEMYKKKTENCCVPKVREFTIIFYLFDVHVSKSEDLRSVSMCIKQKTENCCVPKVREFTSMFALSDFYFSKSEACRAVSEKNKNGCSPNVRKL